ncbi:hypothetical protein L9F63_015004, partial [Diploptera punctata]
IFYIKACKFLGLQFGCWPQLTTEVDEEPASRGVDICEAYMATVQLEKKKRKILSGNVGSVKGNGPTQNLIEREERLDTVPKVNLPGMLIQITSSIIQIAPLIVRYPTVQPSLLFLRSESNNGSWESTVMTGMRMRREVTLADGEFVLPGRAYMDITPVPLLKWKDLQ